MYDTCAPKLQPVRTDDRELKAGPISLLWKYCARADPEKNDSETVGMGWGRGSRNGSMTQHDEIERLLGIL